MPRLAAPLWKLSSRATATKAARWERLGSDILLRIIQQHVPKFNFVISKPAI
jgi:hypothetical protein